MRFQNFFWSQDVGILKKSNRGPKKFVKPQNFWEIITEISCAIKLIIKVMLVIRN